jgi:homoserine kinase type II
MIDFSAVLEAYYLSQYLSLTTMTEIGLNNQLWTVNQGTKKYVLKQHISTSYDNRASIEYEHRLLRHIGALSFALPVPLLTRTGDSIYRTDDSSYFSLAQYFPGERLKGTEQVSAFGAALGELQTALASLPVESRPGRPLFERLFDFPAPMHDVINLTPQSLQCEDLPPLRDLLAWWQEEAQALAAFVAGSYRSLPWQICHNDFTPNNVLVDQQRVTAVLDFEFMSPAARALDVAMALRMTMRIWDNPMPWAIVKEFFAGYARWIRLSQAEVEALPWLLRLRGSMAILWWVGRQQNLPRVASLIENQRTMVQWLSQHEEPFLECVTRVS